MGLDHASRAGKDLCLVTVFVAHPVGWFSVFAEHLHDSGMVFGGSHCSADEPQHVTFMRLHRGSPRFLLPSFRVFVQDDSGGWRAQKGRSGTSAGLSGP
jgi:hypothetical protein